MAETTAKIIDGKKLAEKILLELKGKINRLSSPPGLAVVLVGDDPASKLYVNNKKKACHQVGIEFHEYLCGGKFYPNITETELLKLIDWLNNDDMVDGIIIQLPLPKKFDTQKIIDRLDPEKDVDGFHPKNQAKLIKGENKITPPLIAAIKLALLYTDEKLKDKKAVVVAKNPIFYESLLGVLKKDGLKVEHVLPDDKKLSQKTKKADILISIIGKKRFIKKSMVKPKAIVIDVGTNLIGQDKWVGDVDDEVREVASWLTPVPGGVGPLTVAMLLKNTLDLH